MPEELSFAITRSPDHNPPTMIDDGLGCAVFTYSHQLRTEAEYCSKAGHKNPILPLALPSAIVLNEAAEAGWILADLRVTSLAVSLWHRPVAADQAV